MHAILLYDNDYYSLVMSILFTESDQMFAFYLLPCWAWELGLGGLVAILLHNDILDKMRDRIKKYKIFRNETFVTTLLEIMGWGGLILVLASYAIFNKNDDHFPGYKAMMPCFGVAIYIAANMIRYKKKQNYE